MFATLGLGAPAAFGAFPYSAQGGPNDYEDYRLPSGAGQAPSDLGSDDVWKYASTPEPGNPSNSFQTELGGVRGAHLVDNADVDQAWRTTTGRPDVAIAVLDSGIKWNSDGDMQEVRKKTRLNKGELPVPNTGAAGSPHEPGENCANYTGSGYDINNDGVFNIIDYACDDRVSNSPADNVNTDLFEPQDILISFSRSFSPGGGKSAGVDDDGNGFVDDIVGWDFLDNDNDPFDDVQYGHGTGEAKDSGAEAGNNSGSSGTCPNCMQIHMRVGDSFVADVNRFAQAVVYATDNDVLVVQEALGALNNSKLARDAVDYAYRHGVTVIASAADEAAQHNNWPSSLPHVILVNSVVKYDDTFSPIPRSYLQFNGCTNFNAKITVAIPSTSCSSDATGRGSGIAGIIYSAALNAKERGKLDDHPTGGATGCRRTDSSPCVITPNEVRQIMASGRISGTPFSDDVNFAKDPITGAPSELTCTPVATAACMNAMTNAPPPARPVVSPLAQSRVYPARKGHDQFYGWGRVNVDRGVDALVPDPLGDPTVKAKVPPEAEITSPQWFDQVDPSQTTFDVRGEVGARGGPCSYRVLVAPGHYPNNDEATAAPPGDFHEVGSGSCTNPVDGVLATVNVNALKGFFPPGTDFNGPAAIPAPLIDNGRPYSSPHGFVVKVEACAETLANCAPNPNILRGEDRRAMNLHRDQDMLNSSFPKKLPSADGASPPAFVDLDGDNRNEMVLGDSNGFVHAYKDDGSELSGWPVKGDKPALHDGSGAKAFQSGEVSNDLGGAILGSPAVLDMDRDGKPEVAAADLEGKVYVWNAKGNRVSPFPVESKIKYSGKPLQPFQNVRFGQGESVRRRTQHGFIASPVLADVDGDDNGKLELVAAAMDRHLYAWNHDGSEVPGFPVLVVDPTKVDSIDSTTHAVTFNANAGNALNQGAIVDTPAVGDIAGDSKPEIVVGTNEEYLINQGNEGAHNVGNLNTASLAALGQAGILEFANGRIYAIKPTGDDDSNPDPANSFVAGWPVKEALLFAELLPVVGEGINGGPAIADVNCPANGGQGPKVGTIPAAGVGYVLNADGSSCYGSDSGRHRAVASDFAAGAGKYDTPAIPAVGNPAFGNLEAGSPSFLAPAAGVLRALDLAANEYQGGQDFVAAWNSETGQFRDGFPTPVNDLQFLTGPSVANIDATPTEEVVAGTSSQDLAAFTPLGTPVPKWPKLSTDWTVANPLIGSFGTLETTSGAKNVVVGVTRSGYINVYKTGADTCSAASWPRYHHDNASSGDYRRDAVSPGKPTNPNVQGGAFAWDAPGDDLLCAPADHYEIATSDSPIDEDNFGSADQLTNPAPPTPGNPNARDSYTLPQNTKRFMAVRAVDEEGNRGRVASFDTQPPSGGGNPGGGQGGQGEQKGKPNLKLKLRRRGGRRSRKAQASAAKRCATSIVATLTGGDIGEVSRLDLYVGKKRVTRDGASPFKGVIKKRYLKRKKVRIKARVLLRDGRTATLAKRLRVCR